MRLTAPVVCLVLLVWTAVGARPAAAGPALDDDKAKQPVPAAAASPGPPDCGKVPGDPRCQALGVVDKDNEVDFGVGVRLRSVWLPRSILELFVTRAAGGAHNYGIGVDLTRRRGTTELQLGFEYEHINIGQGVYINKGDDVATGDEADYVLGPNASRHQFGWFTIEFTFLNHAEITKWLAVRYGGGIGLGILNGEIDHYNILCTNATNTAPEPGCVPRRFPGGTGAYTEGTETLVAYGLPPVFPVVNAILGLEIKPTDKMTINIEGGIRTLPFVGVSSSVFF
ncbi:MAG TPA: hypothetical protein VF469_40845 [Kofleriaceae bacterium]